MQYGNAVKETKIKLREDWPTGGSSREYGANLDGVGFNLNFIAERDPQLAVEICKLHCKAGELRPESPRASADEMAQANAEFLRLQPRT